MSTNAYVDGVCPYCNELNNICIPEEIEPSEIFGETCGSCKKQFAFRVKVETSKLEFNNRKEK